MKEHEIRPKALLDEFFGYMKADAMRLAERRAEFQPVSCPGCQAAATTTSFEKDGFSYCECATCGTLFASPRPSVAALMDYALNSRAVEFWSTHFYRETAEARRQKIFRPRAELVAGLVESGVCAGESFIDVGAGYGLFLQEIRSTGKFSNVSGIEPDRRLADICRQEGFSTIETWVEDIADGDVQADVVTAFEVLEHTYDPEAFLAACARLVRPGGILLFTTLTISGFDLQTLWEHSRQISPPQHLNFLSVEGIRNLVGRVGLEVHDLATPGRLDVDIVANMLAENPGLDVSRFARAVAASPADTREAFQQFLQAHRLSSHVRCIARRPLAAESRA